MTAIVIFGLSHQSSPPGASLAPDYVGHLFVYFLLGSCVVWGISSRGRQFTPRQAALSWLVTSLYGLSDEWHQSFVPARSASWIDLAVDSLAALLAAAIGYWMIRRSGP